MSLNFPNLPLIFNIASQNVLKDKNPPPKLGVNPLADNLNVITSLVQTVNNVGKLTGDPLAADLWRLYTKALFNPDAKRIENLMWRSMSFKLQKRNKKAAVKIEKAKEEINDTFQTERQSISIPVDNYATPLNQISDQNGTINTSRTTSGINFNGYSLGKNNKNTTAPSKAKAAKSTMHTTNAPNYNFDTNAVNNTNFFDGITPTNEFGPITPNGSINMNPFNLAQNGANMNMNFLNFGVNGNLTGNINPYPIQNNFGAINQQSWFDPTFANFGSMMNRGLANFDLSAFPSAIPILNQSNFLDTNLMNTSNRRPRTHTNPNALNQNGNMDFMQTQEHGSTAQDKRIKELEAQVKRLIEERSREAVHSSGQNSSNGFDLGASQNSQQNAFQTNQFGYATQNGYSEQNIVNTTLYGDFDNSAYRFEPTQQLTSTNSIGRPTYSERSHSANQSIPNPTMNYQDSYDGYSQTHNPNVNYNRPVPAPARSHSYNERRVKETKEKSRQISNSAQSKMMNQAWSGNTNVSSIQYNDYQFNGTKPVSEALYNRLGFNPPQLNDLQAFSMSQPTTLQTGIEQDDNVYNWSDLNNHIAQPALTAAPTTNTKAQNGSPINNCEISDSQHEERPEVRKSNRTHPSNQPSQCSNCEVKKTSLWRRSTTGEPLCNACGLFNKLHNKDRPKSMKNDVIRKRNRGPTAKSMDKSNPTKRSRTPER